MASSARPPARRAALPIAGAALLALIAVGIAVRGPAGGLSIAGLLAVLVAVPAAAIGRVRWAHIGSRRVAAGIAVIGVAVFLVGAVAETRAMPAAHSVPFSDSTDGDD